ncbi:MAG: hypothetical protein ACO2PP_20790 [Thermocrinis sp.]|jgi:DnaJ-domain-containing protein 1|uniref:hypothetical protein n=1 Tax=Thermocrinis sp. TaxID=2024383 RepID=UPI003C0B601F
MKDWIEKMLSFLGDVIKFVSPVLTFLLGIFYERMKLKKKSKNLKQIIFEELTQFLATFISYSLKCYIRRLINSIYGLESKIIALKHYKSIKDEPFNRSRIKIIEERIRDLEKEIRQQIAPILNNRRQLIDETFGWIFALNKKYEENFSEKIVKEIKDLQESIKDFYDKLEKFHEGLIDGEFIRHFLNKYRSIEPEVTGIYFDMVLSKSITQSLIDLKDFDNGLTKEIINILSEMARLSNEKSKYSNPDFCIVFIKKIKPLIFKIDEILEKEGTNL